MKKILPALIIYIVFAALVFFFLGFFLIPVDGAILNSAVSYKINNALNILFTFVPSICLTGFILACSIGFASSEKSGARFSVAQTEFFKKIIIISLALTFIISMCSLVFKPLVLSKRKGMDALPNLLNEYMELSKKYIEAGSPEQASQYIARALSLDRNNPDINALARLAEIEEKKQDIKQRAERNQSLAETDLNSPNKIRDLTEESGMSILDMIHEAETFYEQGSYFNAHYYASEAARLCEANDPNLVTAKNLAAKSWNMLQSAQMEEPTPGNIFYRKKLSGYKALRDKDYLKSYYIFYGLSQEDARKERDPDVVRYLAIARDELLNSYFFIDETFDKSRLESANNIFFSLGRTDGGRDIILIKGVTEVEDTGGLLRYLRGVEIYSFDKNGIFTQSVRTPYAKMLALDVQTLDSGARQKLAGSESIRRIPYIMLCSVSRFSESERNIPEYQFSGGAEGEKKNQIYWPMPYEDFSLIATVSAGLGNLNPFALNSMARKAPLYGYSSEVFSVESLNRIFYPFMILIVLIFAASIAWNYRMNAGTVFKFKWIFVLPLLNMTFYFAGRLLEYIISLLNFVFIALAGTVYALPVGAVAYTLLLVIVSIVFVSRKND